MKKILRFSGYPIDEASENLKKIQNEIKIDKNEYQNKMKWNIFDFHIKNNNNYSNFINKKNINSWNDIPIMNKKSIQKSLIEKFTRGYSNSNTFVNNTSGSTGIPFFFAKDKFCHAMSWAVILDRYSWHDIKNGYDLQARFYGIPKGFLKYQKEKIKDFFCSRIRFPIFDMSEKMLMTFINKFSKYPFIYVNGYTSSLSLLAKFCIEKKIIIKDICPTLKKVFTTAEICDNNDRKIIEMGFGVKVVNEYGAAEIGLIAFEDLNNNWKINCETIFVEILDDKNQQVFNKKEGRLVVTSLFNKAMPFIRYDLGDIGSFKKDQVDNFNILNSLTGRTNDFVNLPSGKKSPGLTFYYISKKILENGGNIREFQVIQEKLDYFVFEYIAKKEISNNEKNKIYQAMDQYLEKGLKISFVKKNYIVRKGSGKLKNFISKIK